MGQILASNLTKKHVVIPDHQMKEIVLPRLMSLDMPRHLIGLTRLALRFMVNRGLLSLPSFCYWSSLPFSLNPKNLIFI